METISCPRCGHSQMKSPECVKCGIIIEKYLKKNLQANEVSNPQTKSPVEDIAPAGSENPENFLRRILSTLFSKLAPHLPAPIKSFTEKIRNHILSLKRLKGIAGKYISKCFDSVLDLGMYLLVTMVLNGFLFFLAKLTWRGYLTTPVGKNFVLLYPDITADITRIFRNDWFFLTDIIIEICVLLFFITCLCQLFLISRFVFYRGEHIRNIIFSGIPMILMAGYWVGGRYGIDLYTACFFSILPVLCLYQLCFSITGKLIPEISDILKAVTKAIDILVIEKIRQYMKRSES